MRHECPWKVTGVPGHLFLPTLWLCHVPGVRLATTPPVDAEWKGEISGTEPISWVAMLSTHLAYCGFPFFHGGYYWHFPLICKTEKESLETT